jgi:ribonucleoside-diphosphate reductase alpha chain
MLMRPPGAENEVAVGPLNMTRQRLPNRCEHELLTFEHEGIRYTAGVGRFEDGRLAEIFLTTAKHGSAVDVNARDAAVAVSLLLQHGCPVNTLRCALTRNADGFSSGPVARWICWRKVHDAEPRARAR